MLEPMPRCEYPSETVRKQLERVLASPGFARNDRLSRFLRVVVERHLDGRDSDLKESILGIDVFGRKPGFDSKQDSTVRTEAGRLRARLIEYYASEGLRDAVIIELPKGGYTPAFRQPMENEVGQAAEHRFGAKRLGFMIALAGFVLTLAVTGWWWVQHKSAMISIAVLPLKNLSQDSANDYLSDGLTGEIISNLSIIDGLAVRSQTSSFVFKDRPRNVREAGKQLHVDYILEGSVLRVGQQLRINAQLIRVHDDAPLWSGRFNRELTNVFAIQDEISRSIVNSLRLKVGRGRRRYETNAEAYDFYLRARALPVQLGMSGYSQSINPFENAIAKDSSFAPAYAGLAAAHAIRSGNFAFADRTGELTKMRAAAEKAIELDPLLAEAHDALGIAYARDGRWAQSEKSFLRAIELDPSRSTSRVDFELYILLVLGRIEEALQQLRAAEKADPLSPQVQNVLAFALMAAGRYNEASGYCEKLPTGFSLKSDCVGRTRLGQGRTDEAVRVLATAYDRGYLGYAYGRAGRREDAEKLATVLSPDPVQLALIFAGLGDKDRTLEALAQMATLGPVRMGRLLNYPEMALLRGDPRLKEIRKKVGLPE